jgi:hypothetical protein
MRRLLDWVTSGPEAVIVMIAILVVGGLLGALLMAGVMLVLGGEDETYPPTVVQKFERGGQQCVRYTMGETVRFRFEGGLRALVRYTVCEPASAIAGDTTAGCYASARVGALLPEECAGLTPQVE